VAWRKDSVPPPPLLPPPPSFDRIDPTDFEARDGFDDVFVAVTLSGSLVAARLGIGCLGGMCMEDESVEPR